MRCARNSWLLFAVAAASCVLAGCAQPLLAPDDGKSSCRFAVEENFGTLDFHASVLSGAESVLAGAGTGALTGLLYGIGPQAIVTIPFGALIGAFHGSMCSAASQSHPTADADFERFLLAADAGVLKRALEVELNGPGAHCGPERAVGSATPETIFAIEKVGFVMGCAYGQQEYAVAVQWRTLHADTRSVLQSATTSCRLRSFRSVDAWFANPGQATAEIERLLAKTGQTIVALLVSDRLPGCSLRSLETGEVIAR